MNGRSNAVRRSAFWIGGAVVLAAALAVAVAQPLAGDDGRPVLHERVEGLAGFRWDPVAAPATAAPGDAVRTAETPASGDGPSATGPSAAAAETTAAPADAPLPPRPDAPLSDTAPSQFHPDLDTDRASTPRDPNPAGILWSPSPGPYLRQQVFDDVRADGVLDAPHPRPEELAPVDPPIGAAGAERFVGRARLAVADGAPVRIPTPAPEFRASIVGGASAGDRLATDRAGNLFLVPGPERGPRELVLALEADPQVFGGPLDATARIPAAPHLEHARLPATLVEPARRVAERLGVSRDMPVETAVRLLSSWFRSFAPGPFAPGAPGTDYEVLALGRVGLCRHRAYAFVVTAQALGIPARMPISLLHAWAEVLVPVPGPGGPRWLWRRVDLGGAYGQPEEPMAGVAAHVPELPDPFPWPRGTRPTPAAAGGPAPPGPGPGAVPGPGQDAAGASSATAPADAGPATTAAAVPVSGSPPAAPPAAPPAPTPGTPPRSPSSVAPAPPAATAARAPAIAAPAAEIDRYPFDATRGDAVGISGRVPDPSAGVPLVRVVLETSGGERVELGSLAVTRAGEFAGTLTVPADVAPGDYVLRAYVGAP